MTAKGHGRTGRPWLRIRKQVLARDPICTICWARPSTTVDHIVPLSLRPDLAHVLTNLRGACLSCNSAGGARITNAKRAAQGLPPYRPKRKRKPPPPPQGFTSLKW